MGAGGNGSSRLEEGVTHVVRDGAPYELRRTSKTVFAALSSRALVSREWIGACRAAGRILPASMESAACATADMAVLGRANPFIDATLAFSPRFVQQQQSQAKLLRGLARMARARVETWAPPGEGAQSPDGGPDGRGTDGGGGAACGVTSGSGAAAAAAVGGGRWVFVADAELDAARAHERVSDVDGARAPCRVNSWEVRMHARARARVAGMPVALLSGGLVAIPVAPPLRASSRHGALPLP